MQCPKSLIQGKALKNKWCILLCFHSFPLCPFISNKLIQFLNETTTLNKNHKACNQIISNMYCIRLKSYNKTKYETLCKGRSVLFCMRIMLHSGCCCLIMCSASLSVKYTSNLILKSLHFVSCFIANFAIINDT